LFLLGVILHDASPVNMVEILVILGTSEDHSHDDHGDRHLPNRETYSRYHHRQAPAEPVLCSMHSTVGST
jgi:hypothetical protein